MGSIEKQPNGRWRGRYRDTNGRSRSQTFDRKIDAQRFIDDTSTDIRRGDWIDPRLRKDTFDRWADRWWSTTIRLQPSTRRGYWTKLEHHVRPYFGGRRLVDVDYMDVEAFISTLHTKGLSAKTIRECVTIVSLVMRGAVRANVIRTNPATGHSLEVRRAPIGVGDVLDMSQMHRLVDATPERWRSALWLLVLCGLRPSELCGLRVGNVDFVRRQIHVSSTLQPVEKYDETPWGLVEGPPKTAAGDRHIPIPEWLCDDLAALLAARGPVPAAPDGYLFVTRYGNPINRDKFRERVVRPALRKAGLQETIRTYDLRHSHASLLIDLGANPLAVAHRMGHADPAMTLRVYGHLFEGVQEQLSDQLDALRQASAAASTPSAVVALHGDRVGHEQDTQDTSGTRNRGHRRSKSVTPG